jgi:hypothetical protein
MLTDSGAVTLYLAYVGCAGGLSGILLWPAVVLRVILTALLTWASRRAVDSCATRRDDEMDGKSHRLSRQAMGP